MRKNHFIQTLFKFSTLLALLIVSKLSFGQACDPRWNRQKSSNCENAPIQFEANSPGKNTYEWDYGDGDNSGSGTSTAYRDPVHPYKKAGTYIVTYKFSFNGGSICTDTIMITIKESPTIKVRALFNDSQCFAGNKFCFIDSSRAASGSKLLTVKYLFSDGGLYTVNDPKGGDTICHSVIDQNGGYFDLTIEAEDYNGCITKIKYSNFIRVFPKIGVQFKSSAPNACITSVATITNLTDTFTKLNQIASFCWNFGDPLDPQNLICGDSITNTQWWRGPSNNGVIQHTYNVAGRKSGTYVFNGSLTVTTKYGCTEVFTFKGSATISILNLIIVADPDSSCSSEPEVKFTLLDKGTRTVPQVNAFLWNFGDPPSGPANFDKNTLVNAAHSYGLGPWMTSINVKAGPCNVTVFDTITKVGPSSAIEKPFTRVKEDEKYQCVIRDSVHFTNVSTFYHTDDISVFEDSSAVYRYYSLMSFRKVGYYELPLKLDTIGPYGTYRGVSTTTTRFYLDKDTLESFNQSLLTADSIIYYVNGKKVKRAIVNPIISGRDTLVIVKQKEYAFKWPGDQTAIPSVYPPATQRHKEHVLRLWTFGDNFAPKCTTDTKRNKNVGLNCNFSMDSLPVHWYTPWDQIYKYYNAGQFYSAPAEKTVLCKGGRFCYKVRYYPEQSFTLPSDTLLIVPKSATLTYGGVTVSPGSPEKMTGSFRIKKVPDFIAGEGTYTPTLSDEDWEFRTPNTVAVKDIPSGSYSYLSQGTYTIKRNNNSNGEQFELKPEYIWRTYTLSSNRNVVYHLLNALHSEPKHNYVLVPYKIDSIPSKGTYTSDLMKPTRFYLEKDTLETVFQKFNEPDSIYYIVKGVKIKRAISNPIISGNDVLTISEFRTVADSAFSLAKVVITAGRTITAQPTTICIDTIIGGRDTFVQRSRIFIDSAFHRQNFYTKNAQCNSVSLFHQDTVHSLLCKSTSQISLALLPPNAKGLEFKGIKCYAPPSPPYGMEFSVGKTKPGCTQRLLKFNFDSATNKNNWVTHGGFLSPPLPGSAPWHPGYQLAGAYPTAFVMPYGAGSIRDRNPGWVTVGVIIGNGRWLDKKAPLDSIECIDTVWYHNAFRYLYLDSRFTVIVPEKAKKTVCVGDTITFKLVDPIMDSITSLVWNWNDDEGSYYEERTFYYKQYPGPSPTRNDKVIKDWKKGDKWLYNYIIRLNYDGFQYKTIDTIVTGVIRKWSIGVDVSRAGDALKRAFEALGLTMSEIPAADIPLFFGNGTGTGCIDTTGLGSLISYGVTPYRDSLTFSHYDAGDVAVKGKNGKDSIYALDWYRYTDFTKKDSVIISQNLHWRSKSQAGFDTLKHRVTTKSKVCPYGDSTIRAKKPFYRDSIMVKSKVPPFLDSMSKSKIALYGDSLRVNKVTGTAFNPGVYRHAYTKASRYTPTLTLRNTEGCFGPRNQEVDVGFFWQWTYSDTMVCSNVAEVTIKDSIRYFAYEDPFVWLDPKAYWKDPNRFLKQIETKKIDWNEHDDSTIKSKVPPYCDSVQLRQFQTTGIGIPPFKWKYDKPGIYTIRIAMKDSLGCVDTARQKVYVTGVIAGFKPLNAGGLSCKNIISFQDTSKMIDPCVLLKGVKCDEIVDYTWDFGDGKRKSKLKDPSHDFTQNGSFTVRLKVRTRLGCEDSASYVIVINGPRPYFVPMSDTVICTGDSVIFDNRSYDPLFTPQWEWSFGDGKVASSNKREPVGHRYTAPGTYRVFLKQFDEINGTSIRCSAIYPDTSSELVTKIERLVIVKPKAPAAFDLAPNDTICPNTLVTFTSKSDPIYKRFIWVFGNGDIVTKNYPDTTSTTTYPLTGKYKVTLIPDYDLAPGEFHKCLDTVKKDIVVLDVKADFDIIDKDAPKFCFTNKSVSAVSYQWIFADPRGNGSSTAVDPCYTWQDTGCYEVTLIATNEIGCTDTITKEICYTFVSKIVPYNVFTPEPKDGVNDVFKVNAEGLDKFDIVIYNRWGEVVFESKDQNFAWNGKVKNKGADCPEGTYFYVMNFKIKNKPLNNGKDKPVSGSVTLIRGK